jgi:small subunit ribosomal protein MRP21
MSKESNQSTLKTPEAFRTYRRESKRLLNATDMKMNPKDVAKHIPITGPIAGRMVAVNPGNIDGAFRNLKFLVNSNNVKTDKNAQRFYKKPGKVLEEKAIRRKKKLFDAGVRRLIDIVKEAKRRGY